MKDTTTRPLNRSLSWFRDAKSMAKDVQTTFHEIAEELGAMTRTQATDYIKKLMTKGRYSQDVWS